MKKRLLFSIMYILLAALCICFIGCSENDNKTKVLTLNEFTKIYTENAKEMGAKHDFDWTVVEGEKADIIKLAVNESSLWSVTIQKDEAKTISGSILVVDTSEDKKLEEALLSLYAMIKTYEPKLSESVIRNFVANFINQKDSDIYKSRNIIYTKKSMGNNFILFIRYETTEDK